MLTKQYTVLLRKGMVYQHGISTGLDFAINRDSLFIVVDIETAMVPWGPNGF